MRHLKSFIAIVALSVLSLGFAAQSYATDVYLVYAGADKDVMKEIKDALADLKVKSYNVDLLAMADYSGKQKAVAKLSKAKVVVLVKDKPAEVLGDAKFPSVVNAAGAGDAGAIKAKAK
jgi:hypothetical protein